MEKYYKVISWISLFRETYDIEDIYAIAPGSRFIAQKPDKLAIGMLQSKQPVLHFAKGPLDTLLWYDIFDREYHDVVFLPGYPPVQIYEIQPIGTIQYGICHDDYRLNQYGAHVIEFKERIPVNEIVKAAIAVYEDTNPEIHNENQVQSIESWQEVLHDPKAWAGYLEYERQINDARQYEAIQRTRRLWR